MKIWKANKSLFKNNFIVCGAIRNSSLVFKKSRQELELEFPILQQFRAIWLGRNVQKVIAKI